MRWRGERQSDNVEDRRGMSGGGKIIGGGLGGNTTLEHYRRDNPT